MKKVIVITGSGGIGQACIQRLNQDNQVIVLDANPDNLARCQKQYAVDTYLCDLTHLASLQQTVDTIQQKYGHIDGLVQTAGWMHSQPALEVNPATWEKMMSINVESMFFMMQAVVAAGMKEHGGTIVNFASEAAIRGFSGPMASVHYAASKGAVIAMSRQLAVEWGPYQIRVNSVCPGGVLTPAMAALSFQQKPQQIPLGCLSQPEDIAAVVSFLCSDQAKMITGQNIIIDGGCAATGVA